MNSRNKPIRKLKLNLGGPIKLKPTQVHRAKKGYERKKTKIELKTLTKTSA